jgi:DNA-binding GntR family transcriptional regulator
MIIASMRRRPLYAMLVEHFLEEISEGRLRTGDRIPNEAELSRAHGVSRITMRHARRPPAGALAPRPAR